jgi:phage tail sheath protein FI
MATSYKTPGVFIEEIPKFPPSIAAVETAIPAFVGYTAKAEKNGDPLTGKPTKISSLLEFGTYFGEGVIPQKIEVDADTEANNYAVKSVEIDDDKRFYLYDAMRQFYDNGGGDCYVVSVGGYYKTDGTINSIVIGEEDGSPMGLLTGLFAVEKVDEPTILCFPDAVSMDEASFYSLQQAAIMQCVKLQDRVSVLDLQENVASDLQGAVDSFRNNIGINGLKYAMAYAPWVYTSYTRDVDFNVLKNNVTSGGSPLNLLTMTSDPDANAMVKSMEDAIADAGKISGRIDAIRDATSAGVVANSGTSPFESPTPSDRLKVFADALYAAPDAAGRTTALNNLIAFVQNTAEKLEEWWNNETEFSSQLLRNDVQSYAVSESLWRGGVKTLIALQKNDKLNDITTVNDAAVKASYPASFTGGTAHDWIGVKYDDIVANPKDYTANGASISDQMRMMVSDITKAFNKISGFADTILSSAAAYQKSAQDFLYQNHPYISKWVLAIKREMGKIPPSGSVSGVFARVDNLRGVWKAPANESLNSVTGPATTVSAEEQAGMNVDPVAGKSINIIRSFIGKGTLIWGARTLAGNDNEWRYVSVRRFFNMVEESSKKATEQFVFEPNDANTWVKVQGMIENFLTTLWRQGALQGAKPEHAFYVAVGLGKTMTALDILEGRMIVEIGMAVVRPAEFIILRFSHKMAES